tara:strand:- start:4548 stop:7742 length:3195 start_codon:yes stop_codon:yes gene_type:complete
MLHLRIGNQLEQLSNRLIVDLGRPAKSVFDPEPVIVPGMAVARWLSLRMAQQTGISANIFWQLPADLVWFLFQKILKNVPKTNGFTSDALVWRIYDAFSDIQFISKHESLRNYLEEGDPIKRWQLSEKIGQLFEQYLIYRPDWIFEWERKSINHWQAELWVYLIDKGVAEHWLILQNKMLQLLDTDESILVTLPERINIFAVPTLSTVYLNMLQVLSRHIDVVVYHNNFTKIHWVWTKSIFDSNDHEKQLISNSELFKDEQETNALLFAMGRQCSEQMNLLIELDSLVEEEFIMPSVTGLLGCIQKDVFIARIPIKNSKFEVNESDKSLQIHICHGIMREVEVLHDQILDVLQTNKDLSPSDILVLAPDIEVYAPYISSIFGSASGDCRVPWHLKNSVSIHGGSLIDTFFLLLDLPFHRFEIDKIGEILEGNSLRSRFKISDIDKEKILSWIKDIGIYWEFDQHEIDELNSLILHKYTWKAGIDRLLLSYAYGKDVTSLPEFSSAIEFDQEEAATIGCLKTIIDKLLCLRQDLKNPRRLNDWVDLSNKIIEEFFEIDNEIDDIILLRKSLEEFLKISTAGHSLTDMSLVVFREALRKNIKKQPATQQVTGAVMFASLSQGNIVPAQVIYILGLNQDSFPRRENRYIFDLIKMYPRVGDKRLRDEDGHAFFEAILSARHRLYLSYVGRDATDETEYLPSALLSALIDYIDEICKKNNGVSGSTAITTNHPLHPFSFDYYNKFAKNIFSYSNNFMPPMKADPLPIRPLLRESLPPISDEYISLERLNRFFLNPSRMLIKDRLGIHLERPKDVASIFEPIAFARSTRRRVTDFVVNARLHDESYECVFNRLKISGKMPVGISAELLLDDVWLETTSLVSKLRPFISECFTKNKKIEINVDGMQLNDVIPDFGDNGLIRYTVTDSNEAFFPIKLIEFWILHLAANSISEGPSIATRIFTPKKNFSLRPTVHSLELLKDLVLLYREGMCRILRFFPRTSWVYAKSRIDPLASAKAEWYGSTKYPGEQKDNYFSLAFRDNLDSALNEEFESVAKRIFVPLIEDFVKEDNN